MQSGWLPLVFILCGGFARLAFAIDSPVADAAMNGDRAAVRLLLQKKADVNAPQADGATALEWAAYRDDLELADLLIAAGANPRFPIARAPRPCNSPRCVAALDDRETA